MSSSEVVHARVTDGPWGPLLGALAARGFSGAVTIEADGKRYGIDLRRGLVTGATSPLASDSVMRVALTSHLVTPVHISTITRALAAASKRDEIDVVAETAKLSADQARTLRARTITQRAARTFAIEDGAVTIQPEPPRAIGELEIEIAAVIFLGAHMNLSEVRLANELRRLGGAFALAAGAEALLPKFGFGPDGVAIAGWLRGPGISLAELEATHREIDPRVAAATVYALVSCGAAVATSPGARTAEPAPAVPRTLTPVAAAASARTRSDVIVPRTVTAGTAAEVAVPRTLTPSPVAGMPRTRSDVMTARALPVVPRTATDLAVPHEGPVIARTATPVGMTLRTPATAPPATVASATRPPLRSSSPVISRTVTPRWTAESLIELQSLVTSRLAMIDQGADYFNVLGLVFDAPIDAVVAAHGALARALLPEQLALHASAELAVAGARLLDQVTNAVGVLTDPARRGAYVAALRRGGEPLVGIPRTRTEDERPPLEEALHRGLLAMRANQPERAAVEFARAVELDPQNGDHTVLLAWARFCAATDKGAAAGETRKMLTVAMRTSDKPQLATFYLGRVERMLGRDREALQLFHDTLDLDPANLEAAAEVRVLEARLAASVRKR